MKNKTTVTIDDYGTKEWRLNGMLHREDGPAYIDSETGCKEWWINGKLIKKTFPTKKPYRYRYNGNSNKVLAKFSKFKIKIGKPVQIKGYRYLGRYNALHEAVLIKGTKGSIRLSGVCWSYTGEGPHALLSVLENLGLERKTAERVAFKAPRNDSVGTDWVVNLQRRTVAFCFKF